MSRHDQIIGERIKKIEELRKHGINPYPHSFDKKDYAAELQEAHKDLKSEQKSKSKAQIAGRITVIRDIGKIIFAVLQDSTGKIQLVLQEPDTSDKKIEFFKKYVDSGDFVGVKGTIFRTKRGELSILVKDVEMLSKSVSPLPEKWHGLQDKEDRYRKRYVDLIMNSDVKNVFEKRSKIISLVREFLNKKGFMEVETPILQPLYGGTNAKPFVTHLNSLDMKVYLRLAPELYLKRLVVGGFEKVYEIGRNFRNEGLDFMHNPEFTMLEFYEAYADYEKMMDTAEEMYKFIIKEINGNYTLEFLGKSLDVKGKWPRVSMTDSIKKHLKIDVEKMDLKELEDFARSNRLEMPKKLTRGTLINVIFDKLVTSKLDGPIWIIDYPKDISPLSRAHRSKEGFVERFECYIAGKEIGDGWTEIIDSQDQRKRFEVEQQSMRAGNDEAHPTDEDFLAAMEQGMPPLGGIGIGIDRLVMAFTNQASIRDVLLFPFMKPEVKETAPEKDKSKGGSKHG